MTESTKTILIVGAVAVVGYLLYKKFTSPGVTKPSSITATGTGNSTAAKTGGGLAGNVGSLAALGSSLNNAVNSVESTFNNVYDIFGGGSTSTAPTGNNATGG